MEDRESTEELCPYFLYSVFSVLSVVNLSLEIGEEILVLDIITGLVTREQRYNRQKKQNKDSLSKLFNRRYSLAKKLFQDLTITE